MTNRNFHSKNKKDMEKSRHIPVGIYGNEVFIAEIEPSGEVHRGINGKPLFEVIRPVTLESLEEHRGMDSMRDVMRHAWKEVVDSDNTELGFDDWLKNVWSEMYDEDDEEDYPFKDDSYTEYLTGQDRLTAESFIESNGYPQIGTWECSGLYQLSDDFDYVFMSPEAEKIAREIEKRTE